MKKFVICINNKDAQVSLELRKLYEIIPDKIAEKQNMVRIIDESGEDYLYPADWFVPIEVSKETAKALAL